jgi:hypothetical protein
MFYYKPIGIAGAALVGKDTLCVNLIKFFEKKYKISAKRVSIAGDAIKKDVKNIISEALKKEIDINDPEEKEKIRPLLVEYGRYVRKKTNGRYFLEKINKNNSFGANYLPVITDIRYSEYEKDELYWLKNEKKGILIFLKREGIFPANEFEEKNNKILKDPILL